MNLAVPSIAFRERLDSTNVLTGLRLISIVILLLLRKVFKLICLRLLKSLESIPTYFIVRVYSS